MNIKRNRITALPKGEELGDRIEEIIAELDQSVPREGAVVKLLQYGGGPDESHIMANRTGYLRFGIELLKAAIAPPSRASNSTPTAIDVDIEYLISEDSDIQFEWFERTEEIEQESVTPTSFMEALYGYSCLAVIMMGFILMMIGLATVIERIF